MSSDDNVHGEDKKIRARTILPGSGKVIDEYYDGTRITKWRPLQTKEGQVLV